MALSMRRMASRKGAGRGGSREPVRARPWRSRRVVATGEEDGGAEAEVGDAVAVRAGDAGQEAVQA